MVGWEAVVGGRRGANLEDRVVGWGAGVGGRRVVGGAMLAGGTGAAVRAGWVAGGARAGAAAAVLLAGGLAPVAAQEESATVSGRVVAATTGAAVEGAGIALARLRDGVVDSLRAETVTDRAGMFQFGGVGAGEYELTVDHIAYGAFRERVTLAPGYRMALRVTLSTAAIVLEPLEIEVMSDETRDARGLGWARRRLTSAELAPVERSGEHLANALARLMPGIRVRSGRSQPGQILCIEFRDPATLMGGGCRAPIVIVDNVRQGDGLVTLNTLPIANIQSIEALSPGEAGVRYGADSGNGVILIETVTAALDRPRAGPTATRVYDWSLEPEPYPWARNLGTAVAANAMGLLAGYALSRPCLSYETLSLHVTAPQCGFAANTGSRLAIYAAPQIGVGYLTGRVGATDLSRGSMWRNATAGIIVAVPGIVLALTGEDDGFTGSTEIGIFMAVVGAPVASVLADRWFRRAR